MRNLILALTLALALPVLADPPKVIVPGTITAFTTSTILSSQAAHSKSCTTLSLTVESPSNLSHTPPHVTQITFAGSIDDLTAIIDTVRGPVLVHVGDKVRIVAHFSRPNVGTDAPVPLFVKRVVVK